MVIDGNALYIEGNNVGQVVDVSNSQGQSFARSIAGSVNWILLEFGNWKMIPIENVIAACDGGPTKVAARITEQEQILGATFALEIGVDAILIPEDLIESGLIAKSQRGEKATRTDIKENKNEFSLEELTITEVREGGIGDRFCVDLTSLLEIGEGMLVGSSASSLALIHSETVESEFVPTRPFRVNAGPANSYVLMSDNSTKYLSELKMGDEVMIVNSSGFTKSGTIGRIKIEKRPFILIKWIDANNNEAGTFLQQAETVRLVTPDGSLQSVTELNPNTKVLGANFESGRHVGEIINAKVTEL